MYIYSVSASSGTRTFLAESKEDFLKQWGIDTTKFRIQVPEKVKKYGMAKAYYPRKGFEIAYHIVIYKVEGSKLDALVEPLDKMILKINDPSYPPKYIQAMRDRLKGETILTNLMKTIGGGYDAWDER